MSTLFNNNNAEGGFRLRYVEIYNWGTFHGKVYKLQPDGRTSLLTGANGSGKTTLVDALLTLLVPSNKRFYNQSSGAEFKKERDESSYFWGYYGKTFSDADERYKTEQLRSKSDNTYSVLLACFQNASTLHTTTLVQVRWFTNGQIRKVFIVSPYQLNINEHFGKDRFDMRGEWKKRLTRQFAKTDIYDSFKEYAARFSGIFGLKEKALSLFNQTVGIKVLGDLTEFIREQMLEEPDVEEQFKNLHNHYIDLLHSHKAIQKDEKQLALLEPIITQKQLLEELRQRLDKLNLIKEHFLTYFNQIEYKLLEEELKICQEELDLLQSKSSRLEEEITGLDQQRDELITQKAALNIDSQVNLLENHISTETKERNRKKEYADNYITSARSLGLKEQVDEVAFTENMQAARLISANLEQSKDELKEKRILLRIDNDKNKKTIDDLQGEITSLLTRRNRMPSDLIHVREQLLDILGSDESELPFAGELIKVKEDSKYWEDAIERVLHNFSMQLLVPEKFNKAINHFVHSNNVGTRLVYQRIDRRPASSLARWPSDDDSLLTKIEIKDAGAYTNWIEQQLLERFNYWCTDDLNIFYGSSRALTSNGLIRNANRHEKDDRPNNWNKLKYRLGWDNKETVRMLQEERRNIEQKTLQQNDKLRTIDQQLGELNGRSVIASSFLYIKNFDSINWQLHAGKIQEFTNQINQLRKSSDKYQTICDQLEILDKELKSARQTKDSCSREIERSKLKKEDLTVRRSSIVLSEPEEQIVRLINTFILEKELQERTPGNLGELKSQRESFRNVLDRDYDSTSSLRAENERETMKHISSFIQPHVSITVEFPDWTGDVMNIENDIRSLNDLEDLYKTIKNQRLVEHKKRFKEYMDRSMLDALTNFRTWLTNEEDKIKEVIEELNIPLKKITFNKNPDTYLQLEYRANKTPEIKAFREQLSSTIPNIVEFSNQKDEAYREEIFNKIKTLVTELQKEEVWRRKVTDIRNWLTFSAREHSQVDDSPGHYHDNTASYSGGQKAQFTYAILGAAIAHQFGIFRVGKQHKSLRFITVDEAFSKLDPEKSQFLMEFCAQLNLQILVVTPLDKINVAEPYISVVHFVEIKNKNNSIVYNLTMEEYHERKEQFQQLVSNNQ